MTSGLEAFPVPEKVAGEMFRVKGKQFSSIPNNHNSLKCVQLTLQLFQKYFNRSVPQDSLRMLHCETWRGQCCVLAHPFPFFPSTEKLHFPGSVFLFHRGLCIAAGATAPSRGISQKLQGICEHSTPTPMGGGKQPLPSLQLRVWGQICSCFVSPLREADVNLSNALMLFTEAEVEHMITVMQNPYQYQIQDWFLNSQEVMDRKYSQVRPMVWTTSSVKTWID